MLQFITKYFKKSYYRERRIKRFRKQIVKPENATLITNVCAQMIAAGSFDIAVKRRHAAIRVEENAKVRLGRKGKQARRTNNRSRTSSKR